MLSDYSEELYGTFPDDADTDDDGYTDGQEVNSGTDPLDPNDYPISPTDDNIPGYDIYILLGIISIITGILIKKRLKYHIRGK